MYTIKLPLYGLWFERKWPSKCVALLKGMTLLKEVCFYGGRF